MLLVRTLERPVGNRGLLAHLPMLDGFCRWDCPMYENIARSGYGNAGMTVFFPLFPLLARAVSVVTRLPLSIALIACAGLASLASFLVIYRLFTVLSDEPSARTGLSLFAFYPFAFFQSAAYPESLVVLLTATSLWLSFRNRTIAAGVSLGFAVLARHLGLLAG